MGTLLINKRSFLLRLLPGWVLSAFLGGNVFRNILKMLGDEKPCSFNLVVMHLSGKKTGSELMNRIYDANKSEKIVNEYKRKKAILNENGWWGKDTYYWKIVFKNKAFHDQFIEEHKQEHKSFFDIVSDKDINHISNNINDEIFYQGCGTLNCRLDNKTLKVVLKYFSHFERSDMRARSIDSWSENFI